ncbi:hypothetical protein E2C01_038845 [Portunus trituberculatus]|uniref:Uncharacterized protein n=1 Tax=Portunus trituberculatus TaxID=210409 RepID=A0A5B7FJL7_PORTR|nr:hypothetical protein [Portunus trituberculatus]
MVKYSPRTKRRAARKSEASPVSPASTTQRNSSGTAHPQATASLGCRLPASPAPRLTSSPDRYRLSNNLYTSSNQGNEERRESCGGDVIDKIGEERLNVIVVEMQ